ncbi:MAG: hypothetical protein R2749_09515 [Acidimicrobiales bacterium]
MGAKPPSTTGTAVLDAPPPDPGAGHPRDGAHPPVAAADPPGVFDPFEPFDRFAADSLRTTSSALGPGPFFAVCVAGYALCIALLLVARAFGDETGQALQVLACAGIAANAAIGLLRARSLGR